MTADALKAGLLLLFAALVQVSVTSNIQVASGHPDLLLVLVISVALLRGPAFGAAAGFVEIHLSRAETTRIPR